MFSEFVFFLSFSKVLNLSPFMSNAYFLKFIPKCYMFFAIKFFFKKTFPGFIWFKTIKNQLILYNNIFTQMFTEFAYFKNFLIDFLQFFSYSILTYEKC